jgi:hypothetical protein
MFFMCWYRPVSPHGLATQKANIGTKHITFMDFLKKQCFGSCVTVVEIVHIKLLTYGIFICKRQPYK